MSGMRTIPFIRIMIICFLAGGDTRTPRKRIYKILSSKDGGARIYPISPRSNDDGLENAKVVKIELLSFFRLSL